VKSIGTVGLWTIPDAMTASESVEFAQKIENLGYNTLWIPEGFGRDRSRTRPIYLRIRNA
jgi:alkanesulfonate monooxygenase SsuD/methylene tetrahydromethanopterin reductase-like flavin-dependent oxidoreductase (luciferase family)